jgi:hypothetical protein
MQSQDVVSYRVKQVGDTLDLERIGLPTGEGCFYQAGADSSG